MRKASRINAALFLLLATCTASAQQHSKPSSSSRRVGVAQVSRSVRHLGLMYLETVEEKDAANVENTASGGPNLDAVYLRSLNSIYDRLLMNAPETKANAQFIRMLTTLSILQSSQGLVRILESSSHTPTDASAARSYAASRATAQHYGDCRDYLHDIILTGTLSPSSVCDYETIKAEAEATGAAAEAKARVEID